MLESQFSILELCVLLRKNIGQYNESKLILNQLFKGNENNVEMSPYLARALSVVHLKIGDTDQAEE